MQAASNDVEELQISTTEKTTARSNLIHAFGIDKDVPRARIDHTAAAARNRIFIFGGRTSPSSAPSGWTLGAKKSTNPWIFMDWIELDRLNSLI